MATPFIGEIRLFAFGQIPKNWTPCNGSLLPVSQNQALFSILGTTYGGDGRNTFGLPDLRGRVALSAGQGNGLSNYVLGQKAGTETVALSTTQGPAHTHAVMASPAAASTGTPTGNLLANTPIAAYAPSGTMTAMSGAEVTNVGGSPHANIQPVLAISYCIALVGIFPSRN